MNTPPLEQLRQYVPTKSVSAPVQTTQEGVSCVRFVGTADGSVRHAETCDEICQTASVRPTGTTLHTFANCSGHIDRSVERYRDNPAGVFKLTAIQVHFLAMSEIAGIRLIRQNCGR